VINQETDRLSALISDLLDLSRLESGRAEVKKEKLNLEEVISEAVALFERQAADRNIDVRIDIAPEAKSVIADRDMLFTIVKNLISNAVKFSRDGDCLICFKSSIECVQRPNRASRAPGWGWCW